MLFAGEINMEKSIWNNNFVMWPELTEAVVEQNLPLSAATVQGHFHKQKQHLQSTKSCKWQADDGQHEEKDIFSPPTQPNKKCNQVTYILIDQEELTAAYQDMTRQSPCKLSRGNEYILISYHYDEMFIMGYLVKDRRSPTLTAAWQTIHKEFQTADTTPQVWILDNKVSHELKAVFKKKNTNL